MSRGTHLAFVLLLPAAHAAVRFNYNAQTLPLADRMVLQRAPQRVAGLVLSNTGMTIGTAEIWNARAEAIRAGGMEAIADATMERWFSPRFRAGKPEALQLWRTMLAHTPPAGYIDLGLAIRDADYRDAAAQVSVPALCIAGAQDSAPAYIRPATSSSTFFMFLHFGI